MPHSRVEIFDEPDRFGEAVAGFDCKVFANGGGRFKAELVSIDLGRLWMKAARSSTPFAASLAARNRRISLMFLPDPQQAPVRLNGIDLDPDHLLLDQQDGSLHVRSQENYRMASMSLSLEDFAASSKAIAGHEIVCAEHTRAVRPLPGLMARLRALHHAACEQVRKRSSAFDDPRMAHAAEQELVQAMIASLAGVPSAHKGRTDSTRVVSRLEEYLESKACEPVYVAEICAAIGVSGSRLRNCCQEQLGMGPIHYLWLRRMHLARRALLDADAGSKTVTQVATEYGFWELGRFSVGYRTLFGESPSDTIKCSRTLSSKAT